MTTNAGEQGSRGAGEQGSAEDRRRLGGSSSPLLPFSPAPLPSSSPLALGLLLGATAAVSYTHLDVYKRQPLGSLAVGVAH